MPPARGLVSSLVERVSSYGADPQRVRLFDGHPGPEHQDYLDLITARESSPDAPDGVAEAQGKPVLYFVDETRLTQSAAPPDQLVDGIRSRLACRGERAYLARVEPGRIRVAPVAFDDIDVRWEEYTPGSTAGRTLFSRLVNGTVEWDDLGRGDDVFDRLRKLLIHSADGLARTPELRPDVLSLLGRALFFRFLRDRQIITEADISRVAPRARDWKDCFSNPTNAAATCLWLDTTFNGDFLPLTDGGREAFFRRIDDLTSGAVFTHLTAVILGADPVGSGWQLTFDWGTFDFAHVPVGLLSQVYEDFCWHWERAEATATSVHYTPRNIAVALLDEAFHGLPDAHQARVLDPACGAGVFLVLAFRRLYREAWQAQGRRPSRPTIRRLLNRNLAGFDISEDALRLAALSLYLTALELDPRPSPIEELRFENLRDRVLFNFRGGDRATPAAGACLGSLDPAAGPAHQAAYDVVVSNPPWTSTTPAVSRQMEAVCRDVLCRSGVPAADHYTNPDNNPDLPFFIKAADWARGGGRIAMALPARLLLKTEPGPAGAREALFKLVHVTGVISGVGLAKTNVWPGTDQPFILMFARNERPPAHPLTHLVCPHYDEDLNERGEFRLDAEMSRRVSPEDAEGEPWLWKAWCVGTSLDIEVVRRMVGHPEAVPVADYWEAGGLAQGQGYKVWANGPQQPADHLRGLPDLGSRSPRRFLVEPGRLGRFSAATLHAPRTRAIYRGPLVLLRTSPGTDRTNGLAALALEDVAFSESYYGYSAAGHSTPELLVRYLHLLLHSSYFLHFALMTDAQFGAERNKFRKVSIDQFPVFRLESLTAARRRRVISLSERLVAGDAAVFAEIDRFAGELYGLGKAELEVVCDTLEVGQAYRESSGSRACAPPTLAECAAFVVRLRGLLAPLLDTEPDRLPVALWYPTGTVESERTFSAVVVGRAPDALDERVYFNHVLPLADETAAAQVFVSLDGGGLMVGIRNQYRYWTGTRARLLAAEVARAHLGALST